MHITGLHHVAIIASDYARSRDFYCRILGLKVIAENWRADRQSWKLDLALPGGGQLELFSFPAPRPAHPAGSLRLAPPGAGHSGRGSRARASAGSRRERGGVENG